MGTTVDTSTLINTTPPPSQAMDFDFLRSQGITYIQNLGSTTWTDYNLHDPGITILEALAYTITDLSTRANQQVNDLLASKPGALPTEKDFFSAAEILPCSPVTLNDFRKILIDQAKVRNAWVSLATTSEQVFYIDRVAKQLTYTGKEQIVLQGLYNVLLEFEDDPVLGDLNSSIIQSPLVSGGVMEVAYPFWDVIPSTWTQAITIVSIVLEDVTGTPGVKLRPLDVDNAYDYFALLDVTYNGGANTDQIGVTIKVPEGTAQSDIIALLTDIGPGNMTSVYNSKVVAAYAILVNIKQFMSANRNLSEDFFAFQATRVQEIAISATLQIASGIDIEQTLAQLFHRLDEFFSPPIPFYTLSEMLAKPGMTPDQVFNGPRLQYGFIDDNDLVELKRSNIVYTSDLIRIIMSLNNDFNYGNAGVLNQNKGIIAVEDLLIANYISNQPINLNVRNCLSLSSVDIYKAQLSIDKSDITVIKDNVEITYDLPTVKTFFNALMTPGKPPTPPPPDDIAIPVGTPLPIEDYYSIQNEFPLTYGIGKSGLPRSASAERKAQAQQLKGFLLFFEQLLANYLAQLAHIKDLFSINGGVNNTYFWQSLDPVPDVTPLLGGGYASTVPMLLASLERSPTAVSRRNNFLDHLLARFGEDFTDFALLMYAKYGDAATDELIQDKSVFLETYDSIGYYRARSFDYTNASQWGSNNVPSLKQRICGLLGIASYQDQDLAGTTTEGFHMVEHILLRPKTNDSVHGNVDLFLNVPLDPDGNIVDEMKDPYSFQLTFVFPNWVDRFTDSDINKYIQKIIQREIPAHHFANVYWLDSPTMLQFETALKAWLAAVAAGAAIATITTAKNQLITMINSLS